MLQYLPTRETLCFHSFIVWYIIDEWWWIICAQRSRGKKHSASILSPSFLNIFHSFIASPSAECLNGPTFLEIRVCSAVQQEGILYKNVLLCFYSVVGSMYLLSCNRHWNKTTYKTSSSAALRSTAAVQFNEVLRQFSF